MAQLIPFDARDGHIWMNGETVPWREAKVHVLTHGLHYGSCVFEGERAYGGEVFRLTEHSQRLIDSGRILGFEVPYSAAELDEATRRHHRQERASADCYVRPLAWRGSEQMGVSAQATRINVAIAVWEWGAYYADLRLTRALYDRPSPKAAPVRSKAAGLYMICTISKHAAEAKGFGDALMLDYRGYVAETTGANVFLIINGELHTPSPDCFLDGITRRSVIELAKARGIPVIERHITPRRAGQGTGNVRHRHRRRGDPGAGHRRPRITSSGRSPGSCMDDYHGLTRARRRPPERGQALRRRRLLRLAPRPRSGHRGAGRGARPRHRPGPLAARLWRRRGRAHGCGRPRRHGRGRRGASASSPRHLLTREVAKRDITELAVVETMFERKARMIEAADAFVVLPGGLGTLDELLDVVTLRQLGHHTKPAVLLDPKGYWRPWTALVDHVVTHGFAEPSARDLYLSLTTVDATVEALAERRTDNDLVSGC